MKRIGQIDRLDQLTALLSLGCEEALVCTNLRSQEGGMSETDLKKLLHSLEEAGVQPVLLLDRRVQQNQWEEALMVLRSSSVCHRVLDLGLARELNDAGISFDLDLQIGHLNNESILVWVRRFENLRRVVLNSQVPRRQLLPFLSELEVETELMGFGPIAMYHTPRKLLQWSDVGSKVEISSEEMGAGTYPMKESPWGSTLYYNKTLSLLPHLGELEDAGLFAFRIDLRNLGELEISLLKKGLNEGEDIRDSYPDSLLHGFYGENKSDSLLEKIGGRRPDISRRVMAEVLDGRGRDLLVRCLDDEFVEGMTLFCEDGKGRPHHFILEEAMDLEEKRIRHPKRGDLLNLRASKKFPIGTYLYGKGAP